MSKPLLVFGFKKATSARPPPAKRRLATFGDDDTSDNDVPETKDVEAISELDGFEFASNDEVTIEKTKSICKPTSKQPPEAPPKFKSKPGYESQYGNLSSALESHKHAAAASAQDASIYEYDSIYDALKASERKRAQDAEESKKPKYFDALARAAEVRERDRQLAEEKRLRREREAEGDEFADKDAFVTEAYKRQMEENRRLEEAEKQREAMEVRKNKGKGMATFYKQILERGEQEHAAAMKAAEAKQTGGSEGLVEGTKDQDRQEKSATERAREINRKGGNVLINDDGEVVDKRQLLKGGLNIREKKAEMQRDKARDTEHLRQGGNQSKGVFASGGKQAMRERQTRMLEVQLEEKLKRSRQEEEEEKLKVELASKRQKTDGEILSAKERYLARKRAGEEAKQKGCAGDS